jgi:hypothetical protein
MNHKPIFKEQYCPNLFSWKDLENLINIRPLMNSRRVHVIDDGKEYKWDNDPWTIDFNCWPPSLLKVVLEKHHCYFSDMSRCTETINSFARDLEREYGRQTDAHIYLCRDPSIQHPFGIHFDVSDNVIVQCEGKTNFKVWNVVDDINQKPNQMDIQHKPLLDVIMSPGDAIWIPRYYPHLATSKTSRLSVSFPMSHSDNKTFQEREWIQL